VFAHTASRSGNGSSIDIDSTLSRQYSLKYLLLPVVGRHRLR
jgi:hypothetical protein